MWTVKTDLTGCMSRLSFHLVQSPKLWIVMQLMYEPRHEKKTDFAYAKTKTQISFALTAKLISAFVFATKLVQFLYFLNPKFQASSYLLWLCRLVCVGPGRKPEDRFSQNEARIIVSVS